MEEINLESVPHTYRIKFVSPVQSGDRYHVAKNIESPLDFIYSKGRGNIDKTPKEWSSQPREDSGVGYARGKY